MKYINMIALSAFVFTACTNHPETLRTVEMTSGNTKMEIKDDGLTMRMKVRISKVKNPVNYSEELDVRNLSDKQKQLMTQHILDSLYALNQ